MRSLSNITRKYFGWIGLCLALLAPQTAQADRIEFGQGNILYGTVDNLKDGVLVFATEYSKKIKIPVNQIHSVTTDKPVRLKLADGTLLKGHLVMIDGNRYGLKLALGENVVEFQWSRVKSVNEKPGKWTGSISLGGTWQTGNVERTNISLAGDAKREWERDRFSFRILHNYAEEDGSITSRNTFGAMKFDHFFSDSFYSALSLEMLKDEFKDLNLRAILGLGLGYRVWNDAIKSLEFELGITYFSEDLRVGEDERFMSGRAAMNLSYQLLEFLLFKDALLVYPSFDNFGEYRLRNEATLSTALGAGWSLKLSHILDQNTEPAPGVKEIDQFYIFSVQYDF